jgi:very-short-patch-repair endonuclease
MRKIPNLKPQVVVGPYRVDLAILEKRVAIELDGHEFHKSREHRTRDAKRERYLQKQGWQVVRFTGTEIHNDVLQCIQEAIEIIGKIPKKY